MLAPRLCRFHLKVLFCTGTMLVRLDILEASMDNSSILLQDLKYGKYYQGYHHRSISESAIDSFPRTITFRKIAKGAHYQRRPFIMIRLSKLDVLVFLFSGGNKGSIKAILHQSTHIVQHSDTPFSLFYHEKGNKTCVLCNFYFSNTL